MRVFFFACLAGIMTVGCGRDGQPARPPSPINRPAGIFRFHIGLWANLHQTLIHESLLPKPGFEGPKSLAHHSVAPIAELSSSEAGPFRDALDYYDRRFTTRNTFTDEFMDAVRGFTPCGNEPLPASLRLAADWKTLLNRAAPIYRIHFWQAHERTDRAYVDAIRPMVAEHGAWFVRRLEAVYQTPWPSDSVDVEVAPVVAPFGASTLGEPPFTGPHAPLIIVSTEDPGYRGESGLEMIFHESSHLLVDRVQRLLETSAKRRGRSLLRGLWHFVLFYTTGHLAKERLGASYVPYAERPEHHIFDGDAAEILPLLVRAWQPYLDGRTTLDAAVDSVVAAF
ncbi:MAG: hypothetical protein NVS3B20_24820 [Polyangiales bacterium]